MHCRLVSSTIIRAVNDAFAGVPPHPNLLIILKRAAPSDRYDKL